VKQQSTDIHVGPLGHIILILSQPSIFMTYLLEYLRFFSIYIGIRKRSSNKHIINKHAATLARVDIHRQDDGDG
jgi:hypothetical protein